MSVADDREAPGEALSEGLSEGLSRPESRFAGLTGAALLAPCPCGEGLIDRVIKL